ncbi:MAG: DUF2975 domain-containing protein [Propionibacteriaceae bacterium]|nr:DUF2975 domain-containing protein [Propionibacteriaceae bacterium]
MPTHSPWDYRQSATLSLVVTWIALVMGVACVPLLVPILRLIEVPGTVFDHDFVTDAVGPLYACLVFGLAALVILLRLLADIRRGQVFVPATVRRLRLISYCGFAIMAACAVGAVVAAPRPVFIFLGLVAGFLGLLMRVIKNVIDAARSLKEDADFTI